MNPTPHPPPALYPALPRPAPLTFSGGGGLLADDLLQAADDAVLVAQALAVVGAQGLHVPAVLHTVPAQLYAVLVRLLLQLLQVRVLLQEAQQVGHHCHQRRLTHLGGGQDQSVNAEAWCTWFRGVFATFVTTFGFSEPFNNNHTICFLNSVPTKIEPNQNQHSGSGRWQSFMLVCKVGFKAMESKKPIWQHCSRAFKMLS